MRHMHPGGFKAKEPFEVVVMDMVMKLPERRKCPAVYNSGRVLEVSDSRASTK